MDRPEALSPSSPSLLGLSRALAATLLTGLVACANPPEEQQPIPQVSDRLLAATTRNVVAIHVSENTVNTWPYRGWRHWHASQFLIRALDSDGTPYELISDAQLEAGQLFENGALRYPILISLTNEVLSDTARNQIRNFVSSGGYVYVGSSSWTKYSNGQPRPDFALGPEMGLTGRSWTVVHDLTRVGTSPMVNQLPSGTPLRWFLPLRYDITRVPPGFLSDVTPDRLIYEGSHWSWSARTTAVAPATPLMRPYVLAGFSESLYASSWSLSYDTQFGDVNGDGKVDLVGRNSSTGDIQVGLSNGQEFRASSSWGTLSPAYALLLADVDGDGDADLVGRRISGGVDVLVGLSNGKAGVPSFNTPTRWTDWNQAYSLTLADVDGDGDADLMGRPLSGGVDVQVGLSNGNAGVPSFNASTRWTDWNQAYNLTLADVDGDGDADLVGRPLSGGVDVQVGLSNGNAGVPSFNASTRWTDWNQAYSLALADVDGDGDADLVGRMSSSGDVQVGLSNGKAGIPSFNTSAPWGTWNTAYAPFLGDLNGDGRADLLGRYQSAITAWLSKGPASGTSNEVVLATKAYGQGRFIYNATFQPLAGYGGDAKEIPEYKTIRATIDEAFSSRNQPLVRLAAWPYPARAAFIYRHDHVLNLGIVAHEHADGIQGEYYILPNVRDVPTTGYPVGGNTDYPSGVPQATAMGAIIGAHQIYHLWPDLYDYATALAKLRETVDLIQSDTGLRPTAFVAPGYLGTLLSSLEAERDTPFLTAGEQGFSPFPSFSVNPEVQNQEVGSLLQLPVGGIMDQQPWPSLCAAVDLSYQTNALINVYDHAGEGGLAGGAQMAKAMLDYVFRDIAPAGCTSSGLKTDIWKTTSEEIRDWWLTRERKVLSVQQQLSAHRVDLTLTLQMRAARPGTSSTFSESSVALRIDLSPSLLTLAAQRTITLDGVPSSDSVLQGNQLVVRVGSASTVFIRLGN